MSLTGLWPVALFACCGLHSGHARPFLGGSVTPIHQDVRTDLGRSLLEVEAAPVLPVNEDDGSVVSDAAPDVDAVDADVTSAAGDTGDAADAAANAVNDGEEEVPAAPETPVTPPATVTPTTTAPGTAPAATPPAPSPSTATAPAPVAATPAPAPAPEPEIPPPPPPPFFTVSPTTGGRAPSNVAGTSFVGAFSPEPATDDDTETEDDEPDPVDGQEGGLSSQGQTSARQGAAEGDDDDGEDDNTTRNVGIAAAAVIGVLALAFIAWKIFGKKKEQPPAESEVDAQFNALAQSTGTIGGQAPPSYHSFRTNRSSARFTPPAAPIAEGVWTQM